MRIERRRATRLIAGMLTGAMLLTAAPLIGLHPAGAADPLPPLADPTGADGVCEDAPGTNPFSDLGAESAATREVILCLVATGLTTGTTTTTYTPGGTVTRRQMALFIKRLADLLDELETDSTDLEELPAYDNIPDYPDVLTEQAAFREAIGQLTQADIVGGFPDGTFRPNDPVTRRQMAAFVNRLQEFLTGEPYSTDADHFDDDTDDPGEDNLNALASVGIFQGDGQGRVFPGADLTRRQMANILLRDVQVFFAAGDIVSPFEDDGDPGEPGGTATLALTPATADTIIFEDGIDRTTPDDDRTYTASNLPASATGYRIALVNADEIYEESDGTYRFDEEGNTGLVDHGIVTARIVRVNGADADPNQSIGDIAPQSGTITFTVDGNGTESIIPIIYVDGGTNTRLEIDDDGVPSEAFGIGGSIDFVPAEAEATPVNGTVTLADPAYAVVESSTSEVTVLFAAGDTYRIGSDITFDPVSAVEFHEALSTGDSLRTCGSDAGAPASYTPGAANGYCLTDQAPTGPANLTASMGTPGHSAIELAWDEASPADSYTVYRHNQSCSNTSVAELTAVATVAPFVTEFSVKGLTAETTYCFVVTTTEEGDESDRTPGTAPHDDDNTAQRATTRVAAAPTITSAAVTTDVDTGDLTEGDVIRLVFSEPMDPDSVLGAAFSVVDPNSDTTEFFCAETPFTPLPIPGTAEPDDGRTAATCELDAGTDDTVDDDTLTMTIIEDGDDDNASGGNDGLQYPLTIASSRVLTDADDGLTVDVAASADKTIS